METIELTNQTLEIVECKKCGKKMVNIDADQLYSGDLLKLKQNGILVSNPNTEEEICVNCDEDSTLKSWFDSDDDDDSSFFSPTGLGLVAGLFSMGMNSGGGFGGFGGGSSGGGGSNGSW